MTEERPEPDDQTVHERSGTEAGPEQRPAPARSGDPAASDRSYVRTTTDRSYAKSTLEIQPSGAEVMRRIVALAFGVVQVLIGLRLVLLLLNAREAHPLVRGILDVSQVFVGPFEGILRTNALQANGSVLDLAAILALIGWTVLELIAFWVIDVFRREAA